jgi:hypothetical protein
MAFYQTSSKLGVDLNSTNATAQFTLGTRTDGSADSFWVYVQANGAISAGDCVSINATGTATRATPTTLIAKANEVAFAQVAFADTEYGWVARNGLGMTISVSATVSASAQLYLATSSGKLSDVSASGTLVGVQIATTSASATIGTTTGTISWPKCAAPGM